MYLFVNIALSNMYVANKNNVLFFFLKKVMFWPEIGKIHVLGGNFLLKAQALVSKIVSSVFICFRIDGC